MDDDDDFLYGTEEPAVKRARVEPEGAEDDEEPHSQTTKQQEPEDDSESEYESDDSDIDIVIDTGAPSKLASTASAAAKKEAPAPSSAAPEASDTPKEESTSEERPQPAAKLPGIDIDKVGMLDGKPITEHNLEDFEDKPWRMPGADITDYFNYGFDEFTWMAYCDKQNQIRGEYNPQNMMAMMGMSMMGMPGMPGGGQMPMPGGEGMPDMFKMMQGMNPPK